MGFFPKYKLLEINDSYDVNIKFKEYIEDDNAFIVDINNNKLIKGIIF